MADATINNSNRNPGSATKSRMNPDAATLSDVRDDIAVLRSDVAETVSDLSEAGIEAARYAANKVAGQAKSVQETLCRAVAERPGVAMLVAFGAGALVVRALMHKR